MNLSESFNFCNSGFSSCQDSLFEKLGQQILQLCQNVVDLSIWGRFLSLVFEVFIIYEIYSPVLRETTTGVDGREFKNLSRQAKYFDNYKFEAASRTEQNSLTRTVNGLRA